MKALTIRQPWASLIAHGVKTIETRSWSTKYRGPLAIHAGKARPFCTQWEEGPFDDIGEGDLIHQFGGWVDEATGYLVEDPWWLTIAPEHRDYIRMPLGAVVATCTVADVVPIVDGRHHRPILLEERTLVVREERPPWASASTTTAWVEIGARGEKVTDQLPFGDFTPGRYAWLLSDITPCDPVPAKGRLGMWDWEADQ